RSGKRHPPVGESTSWKACRYIGPCLQHFYGAASTESARNSSSRPAPRSRMGWRRRSHLGSRNSLAGRSNRRQRRAAQNTPAAHASQFRAQRIALDICTSEWVGLNIRNVYREVGLSIKDSLLLLEQVIARKQFHG